ncbi:MAG: TRC40/GET3/ArsA family transport-energizing ATPase [Dehalococcoidales bacterium]
MRVILFTGKGGVGKTSVAAATALRAAEMGYRTIILSTDIAHSLSDSFDLQLGNDPKQISPNLWGQEIEIYQTMESYWGTIRKFVAALLAWRGMEDIVADEVAVLPGMEELANLLYISRYQEEGNHDVVIIDCAPTGETMRLLSFPEMMHWWMSRMFPIQRRVASVVRPVIRTLTDIPVPSKEVFGAVEELFGEIDKIRELLTDCTQSSVRLVVNPEKMVVKEAQRNLTYLNLYGYCVDAVVCNRIIPERVTDNYFKAWKHSQQKYRQLIQEGFSPLPILDVPLMENEVVGLPMLKMMAEAIYGQTDPTGVLFQGRVQDIQKEDGGYVLNLALPFVGKEKVTLKHGYEELDIQVASYRRNVILPQILRGLSVTEAKIDKGTLGIRFQRNSVEAKK